MGGFFQIAWVLVGLLSGSSFTAHAEEKARLECGILNCLSGDRASLIELGTSRKLGTRFEEVTGPHPRLFFRDSDGALISEFWYRCREKSLSIEWVRTTENHLREQWSTLLLAIALADCPETTAVQGGLEGTHLRIYEMARLAGDSPLDALRKTPAYRMRTAFGFTEIDPKSSDWDFVARRPTP